jgi:hypothetical protein
MIKEVPLSMFLGHSSELIETLYSGPSMDDPEVWKERNDYELVMNLKPIEGYNPTRVSQPSYFFDDELIPIFDSNQICIYEPMYFLYCKLKDYIYKKIEADGIFKYVFVQSKDDAESDDIIGCYELTNKDDIKSFLVHIVSTVPCSLFEIKENLGLN